MSVPRTIYFAGIASHDVNGKFKVIIDFEVIFEK